MQTNCFVVGAVAKLEVVAHALSRKTKRIGDIRLAFAHSVVHGTTSLSQLTAICGLTNELRLRIRRFPLSVVENDFLLAAMSKHAKTSYKPLWLEKEVLHAPPLKQWMPRVLDKLQDCFIDERETLDKLSAVDLQEQRSLRLYFVPGTTPEQMRRTD